MSKITKQRKVRRKLRVVRMFAYTAVSFTILQYVGLFALAGIRGMYVTTDSKLNAFYPKTYVNVELEEDDSNNHVYVLDEDGNVVLSSDTTKSKHLYVKNPGTNKKDVLVRAKIVATIYNDSGVAIGETQSYEVTGGALRKTTAEPNCWYNENVTALDETVDDDKKVYGKYQTTTGTSDDDYFYYTSVLEKNTKTENLFDSVVLTDIENIPDDGWVEFNIIIDTVEVDTESDNPYAKANAAWNIDVESKLATSGDDSDDTTT